MIENRVIISMAPFGIFVHSFAEPSLLEKGFVKLTNNFPFQNYKNKKLITTDHFADMLREREISMEEIADLLNGKSTGYHSYGNTVLVCRRGDYYDYLIVSENLRLVSVKFNASTLPKSIDLNRPMW